MTTRYKETGYYGARYFEVECPKCHKDALVDFEGDKSDQFFYWQNVKNCYLLCKNCTYKTKWNFSPSYNARVSIYCPECGQHNEVNQAKLSVKPELVEVCCSSCGHTEKYKPNIEEYYIYPKSNGLKTDPFFFRPLWLQTEVCGESFWAYNREHLAEIEAYVSASLRERQTLYSKNMVAWLPSFIKAAKNRERILAGIRKMRNKRGI